MKLDEGSGRQEAGCSPAQRSGSVARVRSEPLGGDCTLSRRGYRAWLALEIFVLDAPVNGQRHVFPRTAQSTIRESLSPWSQPPVRTGKSQTACDMLWRKRSGTRTYWRAFTSWATKSRVFGAGAVADELANLEDDALPDWSRTPEQRAAQAKRRAERAKQQSQQVRQQAADRSAPSAERPLALSGPVPPDYSARNAVPASQTAEPSARLDITALVDQLNQLARENAALRQQLQPGA